MRILRLDNRHDLDRELDGIGASPESRAIFAGKCKVLAIKIDDLSVATANILKQVALSSGADCAVHRDVASGGAGRTGAIVFATPRQLDRVAARMAAQPECVARLVPELLAVTARFCAPQFMLSLGRVRLDLGRRTHVMGVLNVTPDSFSDGGRFLAPQAAIEQALAMEADGADFVDIGAESTRPGALPVPPAEQLRRLRPVLRGLARRLSIPISVDTSSALVAEAALDDGAKLVNDVTALRGDRKMAALVARRKVPCILMHMKGRPRTMQKNPVYRDLLAEICDFLARAARAGEEAGIKPENILVDPGIGFGKTMEHNLEVLRRLGELKSLGRAIVVGPSRKRFLGMLLGTEPGERLEGTLAACVVASRNGANVVRVHDVKQVVRALKVADAVEAKG